MAVGGGAEHLVALLALAQVAGAGIDAHQQVGRGIGHAPQRVGRVIRAAVVPAVFADQETDLHLAYAQHLGDIGAGFEMPAFVEDVVGWQQLLVILQAQLAALQHQQAVVQRLARAVMARGRAHHPEQFGIVHRGAAQVFEAGLHALHEARLVQQVVGVVAAERQLAEDHHVGLVGLRLARGLSHALHIAVDIAHGEVELGQGDTQHGVSFGVQGCRGSGSGMSNTWRR
ncbi:hypothetical protein D3C71_1506460 [compost metagenome]